MGVASLRSDARKFEEPVMKVQKLSADVRTVRRLSADNVGSSDLGFAMQVRTLDPRTIGGSSRLKPATQRAENKRKASRAIAKAQSLRSRLLEIRPQCTLLQQNRIREATQEKYLKALETLFLRLSLASIPNLSIEAWDSILREHLEVLFESGRSFGEGACTPAALLWALPRLGKSTKSFFQPRYGVARLAEAGAREIPSSFAIRMHVGDRSEPQFHLPPLAIP